MALGRRALNLPLSQPFTNTNTSPLHLHTLSTTSPHLPYDPTRSRWSVLRTVVRPIPLGQILLFFLGGGVENKDKGKSTFPSFLPDQQSREIIQLYPCIPHPVKLHRTYRGENHQPPPTSLALLISFFPSFSDQQSQFLHQAPLTLSAPHLLPSHRHIQ
ncbi:hypothetical protein IE53DRAFT_385760 [Violaceomyces palustris]|uniref:Uncharacterized protein n=1 Tax=Violaceomyces palustris TaxID=1673888 RepID=A0ACD0P185_9BASI|nr:hypothetical protein IE53DRAFT_385760 [Violaceomyces palustris]